jgi:zinc protease
MTNVATKHILDNGLTVILKEMRHAPVVCFMVWYRVGSRNEIPGTTGVSHWVEHLLFSGTPSFPGAECDRLISRNGGFWNAFTWLDHTAFFETMPAETIGLSMQIEADRMVNAVMSPEDIETERSIILSERSMYENEPRFLLNEELTSIAFRVHPYHHEVIGDEADIRSITRDDLLRHYSQYYVPNNAIVVATGNFSSVHFLIEVEKQFSGIASGKLPDGISRQEPPQRGERRTTVQGPGETAYLTMAFRCPPARHKDYLALAVLNAIFSGGNSLGSYSGGGSNRSSPLYKALVETGLALSVSGNLYPTIDPFLYTIDVVANEGIKLARIERTLDDEIERLVTSELSHDSLHKALKRAGAQFVLAGESITGQAHLLGLAEIAAGDYLWYEEVLDMLSAITLDDLDRVRNTYLGNANRCIGWYIPQGF